MLRSLLRYLLIVVWLSIVLCSTAQGTGVSNVNSKQESVGSLSNPCKQFGCLCERETISCSFIAPSSLNFSIFDVYPSANTILFDNCDEEEFDVGALAFGSKMERISVRYCDVRVLTASVVSLSLLHLHLPGNYITEWTSLCQVFANSTPALKSLDLSFNHLPSFDQPFCLPPSLRSLNISHNQMSSFRWPSDITVLDVSDNQLSTLTNEWPRSLVSANFSGNAALDLIPSLSLPYLRYLNLDGCHLHRINITSCPRLRYLSLRDSAVEVIDMHELNAPILRELDLSNCHGLSTVIGHLPASIRSFSLTNSLVTFLPTDFFARAKSLGTVQLEPNGWNCHECLIGWYDELLESKRPLLNCSDVNLADCNIGVPAIANGTKKIVRTRYGRSAVLQCEAFGTPSPTVEWWLFRPEILIGSYDTLKRKVDLHWSRNDSYRILPGGNLVIQNANRNLVERYRCIASNQEGNASRIVHFRMDYSYWYSLELFDSVFWGSLVASLLVFSFTFVLNILWIMCRKTGLWWIRRAERLSRVRSMVEAVEKYRQKQMLGLHESYRTKVDHVRDNYHQQVDQLRTSYAGQCDRFRDYRAAQMETMGQHLDSIRDNYTQQMGKLRDYGSRRVEQLWESYERQMNRVRTFSLQQRLKLMRQYKVKQKYVNALMEKLSTDDPAAAACLKQHSDAAVLGPIEELEMEGGLSRSTSFYSLPEYVMDEYGTMHPATGNDLSRMFSRHSRPSATTLDDPERPSTSRHIRKPRAQSPTSAEPLRRQYVPRSNRSSESNGEDDSLFKSTVTDVTNVS